MRESFFLKIALIVILTSSLEAQAAKGEPCSDGSLKGWAKRQGYTQADCAQPAPPPNTAPSVSINSPTEGAQYEQGTVPIFSGKAMDAEDGDLSSAIQWSSEASALTLGSHAITASVTDSGGLTGSAVVTITITEPTPPPNTAPTLNITSPADGTQVEEGTAINLTASASDAEDGNLSGAVSWSHAASDGSLLLPVGEHIVTASVIDSGGISIMEQVTVIVIAATPDVADDTALNSGIANLNWTIPTARLDGSPLSPSELSGYELYMTHEESGADAVINIQDPLTVSHSVEGLQSGTHHFAISALDNNGMKSELSQVVSITVSSNTGS